MCEQSELSVVERETPAPAQGQLLIDVTRCGICGSDLHARHHADAVADITGEFGYEGFMRSDQQVVMGHEFCGVVAEHGPKTAKRIKTGTPVVALPFMRGDGGAVHLTGLSAHAPGAYAEQMIIEQSLAMPVPNGLSPDLAVLTEPMAVAWHAVRRSEIGKRTTAIVIGCGPIGLGVICMLKARGVRRVVASDFSAARRDLARSCGADVVVDPSDGSPYEGLDREGYFTQAPDVLDFATKSMERLRRLPFGWQSVYRAAEKLGVADPAGPVVFECVGVPGIIEQIIDSVPLATKVMVVGVNMEGDHFRPAMAINKEVDLRFVFAYTPLEFRDTLHMIAEGKVDAAALVTGTVGLEGVEDAFSVLADAERHAKILIDPKSAADSVVSTTV